MMLFYYFFCSYPFPLAFSLPFCLSLASAIDLNVDNALYSYYRLELGEDFRLEFHLFR